MTTMPFLLCLFFVQSPASADPSAAQVTKAPPRVETAARAEVPRLLAPVEHQLDQAQARFQKGLRARSSAQSLAAFRGAKHTYDLVLRRLDRVAREHTGDAALEDAVAALRQRARSEAITTVLHAGTIYLARADYQAAVREVNLALAIDPNDRSAQQFRWGAATLPGESLIGVVPFGPRLTPRSVFTPAPLGALGMR